MTSVRGCLAVLALVMVTCACGNEGSTGSTTPAPRHTGSTTPPTQPPPSTPATAPPPTVLPTTPPTTPSPNSSTSTSTSTSTTTAPTTTSTLPLDDQIKKAIQDYFTAYAACGERPSECDPQSFLAPGSNALTQMTSFVDALLAERKRFRANDTSSYIEVKSVESNTSDNAKTLSCWFDAGVIVSQAPDSDQTVPLSTDVASLHLEHELVLVNGRWLVSLESEISRDPGVDTCGIAS